MNNTWELIRRHFSTFDGENIQYNVERKIDYDFIFRQEMKLIMKNKNKKSAMTYLFWKHLDAGQNTGEWRN